MFTSNASPAGDDDLESTPIGKEYSADWAAETMPSGFRPAVSIGTLPGSFVQLESPARSGATATLPGAPSCNTVRYHTYHNTPTSQPITLAPVGSLAQEPCPSGPVRGRPTANTAPSASNNREERAASRQPAPAAARPLPGVWERDYVTPTSSRVTTNAHDGYTARPTCASTQAHDFHGVRPTCARTQDDDVQMSSASPPVYRGHKVDVSQQMREEEQVRLRAVAANGTPGFANPVSGSLLPNPRSLARNLKRPGGCYRQKARGRRQPSRWRPIARWNKTIRTILRI